MYYIGFYQCMEEQGSHEPYAIKFYLGDKPLEDLAGFKKYVPEMTFTCYFGIECTESEFNRFCNQWIASLGGKFDKENNTLKYRDIAEVSAVFNQAYNQAKANFTVSDVENFC